MSGERVLGPYSYRDRWRVIEVAANGDRAEAYFATEEQALRYAAVAREAITHEDVTVSVALADYTAYLQRKGNKPRSVYRTQWSIHKLLDDDEPLATLSPRRLRKRYHEVAEAIAVDSHRNALAETKTFLRWCVAQRWLRASPAEDVEGVGRRTTGKQQLRHSEARAWFATALELGDDGAAAALMTLLLGMRASEVVTRLVRDIDDDQAPCDVLWIPSAKTPAGRRTLEVPDVLRPLLLARVIARRTDAPLFPAARSRSGFHDRDWPRAQVRRICEIAKVPLITAHGMRGQHSTESFRQGATAHLVAEAMGHESAATTLTSYADADVVERTDRRRRLKVYTGGKP